MDISNLKVFSHGFFQDILTVMVVLDTDSLSKELIESIILEKINERNKELAGVEKVQKSEIKQNFTKMPVSKKYEIFKQKNPDSNMTIDEFIKELKASKSPCKGCEDKEK